MVDETTFTLEATALLSTLYRLSMSILHSDADAQDAVQQGLMKAWAARRQAHPERFRAWLTRIVIHECYNIHRYKKRVYPSDMVAAAGPFQLPDTALRDAISAMQPKLRIPLLLKYMENYTEKEIAQALRIPPSTVKGRLHRARRALEKSLKEMEVAYS